MWPRKFKRAQETEMLNSKAPQTLKKSILDDLVNWKWDLMHSPAMIQLHPWLVVKKSYHLLVPLIPPRFSVCFSPGKYSYYKIRINSSWHADSLFILICIVLKERSFSAYSLHLGVALKNLTHIMQYPQLAIAFLEVHRQCPCERSLWFTQ